MRKLVIIRNITHAQIVTALEGTNKTFGGNIVFNRCDQTGRNFNVTLKPISSRGPGSRLGFDGKRHLASVCWHVYGCFFDNLMAQYEGVVITAMGVKISARGGNWVDRNIGSVAHPLMWSDACECKKNNLETLRVF